MEELKKQIVNTEESMNKLQKDFDDLREKYETIENALRERDETIKNNNMGNSLIYVKFEMFESDKIFFFHKSLYRNSIAH